MSDVIDEKNLLSLLFHLHVTIRICLITCLLIKLKCGILIYISTIVPTVKLEIIIISYNCRGKDSVRIIFSSDFKCFAGLFNMLLLCSKIIYVKLPYLTCSRRWCGGGSPVSLLTASPGFDPNFSTAVKVVAEALA